MARQTIRIFVAVLVMLAMMVIVQSPAVAGKKDNSLNIAWEKELETLDFYFQSAREGTILSRHIYDSLTYRDPETMEYKPLLAKSCKWIDTVTIEAESRSTTGKSSTPMTWCIPSISSAIRTQRS